MDAFATILASLFAGLAATALFLYVAGLVSAVQVEKTDKGDEDFKRLPLLFRMAIPLAPNSMPLVRKVFPDKVVKDCAKLSAKAGYSSVLSGEQYLSVRIVTFITGVIFFSLASFAGETLCGFLLFLLLVSYPSLWIRSAIAKRHLEILKALPNVLDLLSLSVEAGRDFLTALREISSRRRNDALSSEFRMAVREIQLGKPRRQALREMEQRNGQTDLSSVINAIIQSEELGVGIGNTLKIQSEQIRMKRFSRAEKLANEAPVKILFPVVVFIFPSVFIILMGPVLMQAMKAFAH